MGTTVTNSRMKTMLADKPKIDINEDLRRVEISGSSKMIDPHNFYTNLQKKMENIYNKHNMLFIDLKLEYVNSVSLKWIFQILEGMYATYNEKDGSDKGCIEVIWYYEKDDEIIFETGEILSTLVKLPFYLRAYSDEMLEHIYKSA